MHIETHAKESVKKMQAHYMNVAKLEMIAAEYDDKIQALIGEIAASYRDLSKHLFDYRDEA